MWYWRVWLYKACTTTTQNHNIDLKRIVNLGFTNRIKMDIPRNTESMFSCGNLTSFYCEHNKHSFFSTGPCDTCKLASIYGSSPKSDSMFTPSSSYGSPPADSFINHKKRKLQVRWRSEQPEVIPDIPEGMELSKIREDSIKPKKSILKQKENCLVVVHGDWKQTKIRLVQCMVH